MPIQSSTQNLSLIVTADLVGTWSLGSYSDTTEGAEIVLPFGPNPIGLLIYTPYGYMSAQLMSPDHSPLDAGDWNGQTQGDYQENARGFIAYSGEYQFDEATSTVSHMPSVSFVPSLIGQRLKRQVKLDGDRLTLTVVTSRVEGNPVKSSLCWLRLHRELDVADKHAANDFRTQPASLS
jgi:hypothetical protein